MFGVFDIIRWWELRRLSYNMIVGATGVFTIMVILGISMMASKGNEMLLPDPPIVAFFGVIAYGIAANVCFAGGWFVEIIVRKIWGERTGAFGEIAFALGLVFSVLLTLAPTVLYAALWGLRLLFS